MYLQHPHQHVDTTLYQLIQMYNLHTLNIITNDSSYQTLPHLLYHCISHINNMNPNTIQINTKPPHLYKILRHHLKSPNRTNTTISELHQTHNYLPHPVNHNPGAFTRTTQENTAIPPYHKPNKHTASQDIPDGSQTNPNNRTSITAEILAYDNTNIITHRPTLPNTITNANIPTNPSHCASPTYHNCHPGMTFTMITTPTTCENTNTRNTTADIPHLP